MKCLLAALALVSLNANASLKCIDYSLNEGFDWVVDRQPVWFTVTPDNANTDAYCWISGKELTYVQHNFTGLPTRALPTVEGWQQVVLRGEQARFVFENL